MAPICCVPGRRDHDPIAAARILVAMPTPVCMRIQVGLRGR